MFEQIIAITWMNLRNIPARAGASSVIIVGIAGVVAVLMALLGLVIFGGDVLFGFSAAMIFGVIVGTYSSIYVSATILIYMNLRRSELMPPAKA